MLIADTTLPKKYYNNPASSMIGFILLNHSRLLQEIRQGDGDFVQSIISQKENKLDIKTLQNMASTISDPYQFAKTISEY